MGAQLYYFKKLIPPFLLRMYHYSLALAGALLYNFPSKNIFVVAITGTKGKTTVAELVNAILERWGRKTALSNTIRFKIGSESERNLLKMTMPGRFFIQRFLAQAVKKKCRYAVIEMTSEGVRQFRHAFIELDALVFTNLSPEHIESHGSYEKYRNAKLEIAKSLETSRKENKIIVANTDDKEGRGFLSFRVENKKAYGLYDAEPYTIDDSGIHFTYDGIVINSPLRGEFNLYNMLAAGTLAKALGVPRE